MKVAIVIENYTAGGSDVVAREIARLDRDNEYCFFVNKSNDIRNLEPIPGNASVVFYNSPTIPDLNNIFYKANLHGFLKNFTKLIVYPLFLSICLIEVSIKIVNWSPRVVISNNGGYPGGYITRFLPLILKVFIHRQFMIVHNLPTGPRVKIISSLIDFLVSKFVNIISVSNEVRINLSSLRNIESCVLNNSYFKEIRRINHGKISNNKNIVLWCIGSISPIKNQVDLVEKIISIENYLDHSIELNFVGMIDKTDNYTQQLLNFSKNLKSTKVKFHGFVRNFQYKDVGRQFLILNSTREGLPLVILEAMASGIPTVSTPVGGVPEVIKHGWNGFIFKDRDQFFDIMKNFDQMSLSDWLDLSKNSLCTAADYSPETYLTNYRDLIK